MQELTKRKQKKQQKIEETIILEVENEHDAIVKKAESLLKLFAESRWLSKWFSSGYYNYTINELKKITGSQDNLKNRDLVCRLQFIYDHTKNWDDAVMQITQMLQMEGF